MAAHQEGNPGQGASGDQPQGRGSFVPRWRQRAQETPPAADASATDPPAQTPARKFEPRWRQRANEAESPPSASEADQDAGVHPNLKPSQKFQPRWRQRAEDLAAKEKQQQLERQAHEESLPESQKPGFQARWRRTTARSEAEASVQPEAKVKPTRKFQPRWRQNQLSASEAEAAVAQSETPASTPAGFVPRWRRTAHSEPIVEQPEGVAEQDSPAESGPPEAAQLEAAAAPAVEWEAASVESIEPAPEAAPMVLSGASEGVAELMLLGASQPGDEEEFWEAYSEGEAEPAEPSLPSSNSGGLALAPEPVPSPPAPAPVEAAAEPPPAPPVVASPAPTRTPPPPAPEPPRYTPSPAPAPASIRVEAYAAPPTRLMEPPPARSALARSGPAAPDPAQRAEAEKKRRAFLAASEKGVGGETLSTFTRQLSVMIGSGLPLLQALTFFAESSTGRLAAVVDDLATKISSGFRLSAAMSQCPAVFSEVYIGLIELGETTSHIDEALEKLADLLEKQVRLSKRMTAALVYPAFLVAVSLGAVAVFLQYVLPTMIPLFASFNMELPLPTRMLLFSRHLVWPTVVLAIVLGLGWLWLKPAWLRARREKARWVMSLDRFLLRLPVLGKFLQQIASARILFALATMLETGLPLLSAMKRCESVAANLELAGRLERAGAQMREGVPVAEAMRNHAVLPAACIHLVAAGEETAQMPEMVAYAARFYEEEVEHSISTFMNLVEPIIMVFMGFVVGFIVLAAVLPTVQMVNNLGL